MNYYRKMSEAKILLLLVSVCLMPEIGIMYKIAPEFENNTDCDIYCYVTPMNITEYYANCSYRNLSDVPELIQPNMTAYITSLNLVGNLFKSLRSVSWEKFKSLRQLSLARNQIDVLEDGNFDNLSNLEVLDLSWNHIRYTQISENVFEPLPALRYLDLKQNLSGFWTNETYPAALNRLPELEILMIDGLDNQSLPYMSSLTELYLSGEYGRCNITSLNERYFSNVNTTQHLYISNCSIRTIARDTFIGLWNITSLDLARNTQLGFESLPNITYGLNITRSITRLNLNSLYDYINYDQCSSLELDDVKYLTNTSLEMMTLERNYIVRMTEKAVDNFPASLRYLSISDNMFMYGKYVAHMINKGVLKNLVYFDTSKMYKNHYPVMFVSPQKEKEVDRMRKTLKSKCIGKDSFAKICDSMLARTYIIDDFEVILSNMRKNGIGPANQLPNCPETRDETSTESRLEYLDLSENLPVTIHLALKLFNNSPNITFLNVSNNYLGYPLLDDHTLFKSVKKLHTLDISNNRITTLMPDVFVNLTKLRRLYLSNNRLTSISFNLNPLKALTYLDLSHNRLENISKEAREALDKLTNVTINLAHNNLKCTCKNIEFVTWLRGNKKKFDTGFRQETKCTLDNDTSVPVTELDFDGFYSKCVPQDYHIVILVGSLCILAFIIIVSCGLVYRFKWNLRYLYYMAKFKLTDGYQPLDDREYDKDVFVSYANEDRGFVRQHIVKELETDGNVSLLIHDRDFRAGEFVADNIMRAITSTRRTLIILTADYIRSKWCMYELNMARMEAADTGRNVLCVILKEDIPVKYLPIEVIDIIQKKTYMEFPTEDEHKELFWNRLRATLHHEI